MTGQSFEETVLRIRSENDVENINAERPAMRCDRRAKRAEMSVSSIVRARVAGWRVVSRLVLTGAATCFVIFPVEAQYAGVAADSMHLPDHRPPPQPPYPYPTYPLPTWVHPNSVRCEQDRLLTDNTPCGPETESSSPLKTCQQDRLLTDTTPCRKP